VNDTCKIAFYYDASDGTNPWKDTRTGDLMKINNTMALWFYLTSSDQFVTAGRVPVSTDIPLYEGWNFVGFPSFSNSTLDDALNPVNWEAIRSFEAGDPKMDYWKHNYTEKPDHMKDPFEMKTGYGYWILVAEESTWTVFA
jgi:hypothetical protein